MLYQIRISVFWFKFLSLAKDRPSRGVLLFISPFAFGLLPETSQCRRPTGPTTTYVPASLKTQSSIPFTRDIGEDTDCVKKGNIPIRPMQRLPNGYWAQRLVVGYKT